MNKESRMATRRLNLAKLPAKKITLVFPTDELAKTFGLPPLEPDDRYYSFDWYPSDRDILDASDLDISEYEPDEEGGEDSRSARDTDYVDSNNKPIPEEVMDDLKMYMSDALRSGIEAKMYQANKEALEDTLLTFSDYPYEYSAMDDERGNYVGMHGRAQGIQHVDIQYDKTTITTYIDIVNAINDCINGVGEFYATADLEGDTPEDFAKTRFHWLAYYWKIYGGGQPGPSDVQEDFDDKYFAEMVSELEKSHDLVLLTKWARDRYLAPKPPVKKARKLKGKGSI